MTEEAGLTLDEIHEVRAELSDLWREHRKSWVTSHAHHIAVGPLVYGYVAQAYEFAEGVFAVERAGSLLAALPLARCVLEFSMTAAWQSVSPQAVDDVLWASARSRRAALEEIQLTGLIDVSDALEDQESELAGRKGSPVAEAHKFRDRCLALVNGQAVYAHYRVLSSYSHPGARTADSWLAEQPAGVDPPFRFRAQPDVPRTVPILGTTVCMMLIAQKAADLVQVEPKHEAQLTAIAARMGISADIRLAHD